MLKSRESTDPKTSKSLNSVHVLILALIFLISFLVRLFSITRYESIIHEFDPWFNYRVAQYMVKNGYKAFFKWFDTFSWYPLGRHMGETTYPGLMISSLFLYRTLHFLRLPVHIREVCVFMGPLVSGFNSIVVYLIAREAWTPLSGLFAALLFSVNPAYISRSVAGSYDYECLAIFTMTLTFYFWMKAYKTGSSFWSVLSGLAYFYMVSVWGGYIFVLNLIAFHVFVLFIGMQMNENIHKAYSIFYILGTFLTFKIPMVSRDYFMKAVHLPALGIFGLVQLYKMYIIYLRLSEKNKKSFLIVAAILSAVLSVVGAPIVNLWAREFGLTGRVKQILGLVHGVDLVSSVAEHSRANLMNFYRGIGVQIVSILPLFIALVVFFPSKDMIFLFLYLLFSTVFTIRMVRVILVLSPIACICAGIFIASLFKAPKLLSKNRLIVSTLKIILSVLFYQQYIKYLSQSLSSARYGYSNPSVMLRSNNGDIIDDFREGFSWLKYNTPTDSKVLSWWDYGYQITGFSNRTVYVDNNTRDNKHIALVGMILASPEEEAYRYLLDLNVDYILVQFGGLIGYSSDDIAKAYWIFKISSGLHPKVKLFNSLRIDENGDKNFHKTILFKMCYYRFQERSQYDQARKNRWGLKGIEFKYLEEAYSTKNWLLRIYRVKKLSELSPEDAKKFGPKK